MNSGMPFTAEMADRIIADLNDTRIKRQGLSLSGGDPLHPQNVTDILKVGSARARRMPRQRYLGLDRL